MPIKVAIQGYQASFHDIAAHQFLGNQIDILACDSFGEVFKALSENKADKAVVAIENSLFGSINEVYDTLLARMFWISGEVYLRISQCLVGLAGTNLKDVREVHSHPVALAQCENYLDTNLPTAERFEHHDTAASAADVKKWADQTKVAIASEQAAKLHGLAVLARDIETHKQNYTRFVVIDKKSVENQQANKTSLVMTTGHKPGALYNALGIFASRNMNLTKLQSRPIIGQAWHYMFYIDVSAGAQSNEFKQVLSELKKQGCEVTVLGTYQTGQNKT